MRVDITFDSHGCSCRGWFYAPKQHRAPAIVMSHGFSAVKEQALDRFADAFAAAGFAVFVFDYRHLGASDGAPRGRIIPSEQHDDLRAALAWLTARAEIDAARIGMWGTSYSGGHAVMLGALDPRVKAVVAQVAAVDPLGAIVASFGREGLAALLQLFAADHQARNDGMPGGTVPVVAPPDEQSVLATPDAYAWFNERGALAPNWRNEVTIESVARLIEYAPKNFIELIAPKPLLLQAAVNDTIIPIASIRDAFARAGEPKKLSEFECGHFDFYEPGPWHERAASEATTWFKSHLRRCQPCATRAQRNRYCFA